MDHMVTDLRREDLPFYLRPKTIRVFLLVFVVTIAAQLLFFCLFPHEIRMFSLNRGATPSTGSNFLDLLYGVPVGVLLSLLVWPVYRTAIPDQIRAHREIGWLFAGYTLSGIIQSVSFLILLLPSFLIGFIGYPPYHELRAGTAICAGFATFMYRLLKWVESIPP